MLKEMMYLLKKFTPYKSYLCAARLLLLSMTVFCLLGLFTGRLNAQTHKATLTWTLSPDDTPMNCSTAGICSQTVYRASGSCGIASNFIVLATLDQLAITYVDTTIIPGTWCYGVSFSEGGLESVKATVTVSLPPTSPTNLSIQVI